MVLDTLLDTIRSGLQQIAHYINFCLLLIQNYAWHFLLGALIFYYIYKKFVRAKINSIFGSYECYKLKKNETEYAAKYHKDPDLFAARLTAQQERAQKLQEKYDEEAKMYQAKLKQKEQRKREEVLRLLDESGQGGGNRLGQREASTKSFKPDYNPLMGPGSSSNYRPQKKTKCGGGGCG